MGKTTTLLEEMIKQIEEWLKPEPKLVPVPVPKSKPKTGGSSWK
jgi:hypothetical protein